MSVLRYLLCFTLFAQSATAMMDLRRYEDYMNSMTTLEGTFEQTCSDGRAQTGTVYISRPGKMRLDYDAPSPLLVVANGEWLITYDRELDEATYISLDNTPAGFILRPKVMFSNDVKVVKARPLNGTDMAITVVKRDDEDQGQITLVFAQDPVVLKEWTVVDSRGNRTRVVLNDLKLNEPISQSLFKFDKPTVVEKLF